MAGADAAMGAGGSVASGGTVSNPMDAGSGRGGADGAMAGIDGAAGVPGGCNATVGGGKARFAYVAASGANQVFAFTVAAPPRAVAPLQSFCIETS